MKQREMNPVRLVLDRGLNQEKRWVRHEDGTKTKELTNAPKGVVLGPVQAMVLAAFIHAQQERIAQLDALLVEALKDDDEEVADEG